MQRAPFPVDKFNELWSVSIEGCKVLDVRYLCVVASWWLLREIEAAALQVGDVHISEQFMVATLNLAASKTDIAAKGALRSHGCSCGGQASESD
eukprot:6025372-Amphidinium_carterae.1